MSTMKVVAVTYACALMPAQLIATALTQLAPRSAQSQGRIAWLGSRRGLGHPNLPDPTGRSRSLALTKPHPGDVPSPYISLHLPVSPRISPCISPHLPLCLPASPYISPHLPLHLPCISPYLRTRTTCHREGSPKATRRRDMGTRATALLSSIMPVLETSIGATAIILRCSTRSTTEET